MLSRGFLATTAVPYLARGAAATGPLQFPPGKPEYNATQRFSPDRGGVVVRLLTEFGLVAGGPRTLQAMGTNGVKPLLLGSGLWRALEYQGMKGLTGFALPAADIALRDIRGKAAKLPAYLTACGGSPKTPLTDVRGSVDSMRYRAATVMEWFLPRVVRPAEPGMSSALDKSYIAKCKVG